MSALSMSVSLPTLVAIIGMAAAYAAWSIVVAVRRTRPRLAARITATVLVAAGMMGLGLQPRWRRLAAIQPVVLVTEGAPAVVVDSLSRTIDDGAVVVLGDTAWRRRALSDNGRTVAVVGYGLAPYQWAGYEGRILYRASVAPDGLVDVVWQREIVLGRELVVEGRMRSSDATWIVLTGPGGVVDSAHVRSGDDGFRLRDRPRSGGRHLYTLSLRSDTATTRVIGVSVVPPRVMSVLILADRPRFSTRFLRDWLTERGATVAIRTQVSQSLYRYEFVNRAERRFATITATTLSDIDVVIVDARALSNLSVGETRRLRDAVEREGIGLLALVGTLPGDEANPGRAMLTGFRFAALDDELDQRMVGPRWVGGPGDSVRAVPAYPWTIEPGRVARPLMWDGTGQIVAAVGLRGAGRVVVTVIAEPERWIRRGQPLVFGEYWAQLFGALTEGHQGDRWDIEQDGPVMPDRPVALTLLTDQAEPRAFVRAPSGRDEQIALVQDTLNAMRWRGLYWPREPGWHQVRGRGDSLSLYVTARDGWETWDASQRMAATARRAAFGSAAAVSSVSGPGPQPRPLPLVWFWLLTLGAASYLWAEDKLFS